METFIYEDYIKDISLCDRLIEYHSNFNEYKFLGSTTGGHKDKSVKDSVDVVFYNNSRHSAIQQYWNELSTIYENYYRKYNLVGNYRTVNGSNIQYYPPGGGFKVWHCERDCAHGPDGTITYNRALVFMTYLNDVDDQGETEWLYQKVKIKPRKGLTVIWPTDFTHTHRGIPSPTQEKWIVTGWFALTHKND